MLHSLESFFMQALNATRFDVTQMPYLLILSYWISILDTMDLLIHIFTAKYLSQDMVLLS